MEDNLERIPLQSVQSPPTRANGTFQRCMALGVKRALFEVGQKEVDCERPIKRAKVPVKENIEHFLTSRKLDSTISPEDLADCRQIARSVLEDRENYSIASEKNEHLDRDTYIGLTEPISSSGEKIYKPLLTTHQIELVRELEKRLFLYRRQWQECIDRGAKKSAKRKCKRIILYKRMIENVKQGMNVDLEKLPNPIESPVSFSKNPITTALSKTTGNCKKRQCKTDNSTPATSHNLYNDKTIQLINDEPSTEVIQDHNTTSEHSLPVKETDNFNKIKPLIGRKQNYCIECKKMVKEFCKHYEKVHRSTPEGKKLNDLNQLSDSKEKKKLKTEITDLLRKRGNAEYSRLIANEQFQNGGDAVVLPVKRTTKKDFNQDNSVQCAHCLGFYKRRKFSQHLRLCKQYKNDVNVSGLSTEKIGAVKNHSLPVVDSVKGASEDLMKDVINKMIPRELKSLAVRDPLIMQYASEIHKSRRNHFQKDYIARIILDLARILKRMQETVGEKIKSLDDIFSPIYFSKLVECVLQEGGYDPESGTVTVCGLNNRLRSHLRGAAETSQTNALVEEHSSKETGMNRKRKEIKHFLEILDKKWASEAGRIFEHAAKKSLAENDKKLAAEEDIVTTCQYITSRYKNTIEELNAAPANSKEKCDLYNTLLDLIVTHIMCLIRRRPVDFKRGLNRHYEKLDKQEELIEEIKNSQHMKISEQDLQVCKNFKIFYVPGKGWKEMVPMALTSIMQEAMDTIQKNKKYVSITSDHLFVRANNMMINPRECIKKVVKNLKLKRPLDLSGNGLRHHAGTFSKLHSSHPQYQDYLASALGHTLHVHKMHYEMPTSILQKLIVCPVLNNLTKPVNERQAQNTLPGNKDQEPSNISNMQPELHKLTTPSLVPFTEEEEQCAPIIKTPEKVSFSNDEISNHSFSSPELKKTKKQNYSKIKCEHSKTRWSEEEKRAIYKTFGQDILSKNPPKRQEIVKFVNENSELFLHRDIKGIVAFIYNKAHRKQKDVTPEVKKFCTQTTRPTQTHRKITNVII